MGKLLVVAALSLLLLPSAALAGAISFYAPTTAANSNNSAVNADESNYADGLNQFNLDHHRAYTWRIANVGLPQGNTITGDTFRNIANWDTNSFCRFGRNVYVAQNFSYNFTAAQVSNLANYILSGSNFACGVDPDRDVFALNTHGPEPVPEPATLALLGTALMTTGFFLRRRRQAKDKGKDRELNGFIRAATSPYVVANGCHPFGPLFVLKCSTGNLWLTPLNLSRILAVSVGVAPSSDFCPDSRFRFRMSDNFAAPLARKVEKSLESTSFTLKEAPNSGGVIFACRWGVPIYFVFHRNERSEGWLA